MASPELTAWRNMIARCTTPTRRDYARYGGRGIRVCEAWMNSFETFLTCVGPRPSQAHSLDRINNAGAYEPGNVRWATLALQATNKRNNRFLDYQGRRMTVAEWERALGIRAGTLKRRVLLGWSAERTLSTPIRNAVHEFNGSRLNLAEWSKLTGICYATLAKRITLGWSIEKTLTTPVKKRP